MSRQKFHEEYEWIQQQISQIQQTLLQMPKGKLLCSKSKEYVKWYVSDGHTKVYIPKKKRLFAEQLAVKKYLNLRLEYLKREKRAIERYERYHTDWAVESEKLLSSEAGFCELLAPYFQPKNERFIRWMKEDYERNRKYPEHLIHRTSSGVFVRSKSEAMIERFLYENKIPYRYECALEINGLTLYPDFTILHPETEKVYYWEHFGRMDDLAYVKNMCSKLQLYAKKGIIPSIQLIMTYETKEHPLSYDQIEKVGREYFL